MFKDSNFSEKSAWISLILTIVIAIFYGVGINNLDGYFETHASQIGWLWIEITILVTVLAILAFVALWFIEGKNSEPDEFSFVDERDNLIETKATSLAYWTFHFCIFVLMIQVICKGAFENYPIFPSVPPIDLLLHGLVYIGLLVEVVLRVIQIRRYHQVG